MCVTFNAYERNLISTK